MFGFSWWYELLAVIIVLILIKVYFIVTCGRTRTNVCMAGKTVLITGANAGIGYGTALELAKRGARVIMACRNKTLAEDARDKIIAETNNPNVVVKIVNMDSLQSVRDLAADINKTVDRLDVFISNAGVGCIGNGHTSDGLHRGMQINHFAPFLLAHLLLDLLKKSTPSRIVFVASKESFQSKLTLENLNFPDINEMFYEGFKGYANSKLCNVITSDVFARRLKGTGITSNSLHPGVVKTEIFKKSTSYNFFKIRTNWFVDLIVKIYGKTLEEGIQTTLHLAIANEVKDITGEYWVDCKIHRKPARAKNIEFEKKIFEMSEKLVKLQPNEKLVDV